MAFNVFHLMADIPAALQRVHGLLAPGGLLISKTPCIGEINFIVRLAIPLMHAFNRAPFVNFVKTQMLRESVSDAGYTTLSKQSTTPRKPQPVHRRPQGRLRFIARAMAQRSSSRAAASRPLEWRPESGASL
jgi:hypothetical protein